MDKTLKSHISDFAYQIAKSTPSRVVMDNTAEERIYSILHQRPVSQWSESKQIAQVCKEMEVEDDAFDVVRQVQIANAHAIASIRDAGFVFADLVQTPKSYDPSKAKKYEVTMSVSDVEEYVAKYSGRTTDDNNFADAIVMGRALSSWIDWRRFKQDACNGLTILRDTESGLPVGEYVFRVTFCSLQSGVLRFDNDYADEHLGNKGQWVFHQEAIRPTMGISQPYTITVALSKSSNHGKDGSVDTNPKGKKEKHVKEQDVPGPQLGI